jgi:hypothetical protein
MDEGFDAGTRRLPCQMHGAEFMDGPERPIRRVTEDRLPAAEVKLASTLG